MNTTTTKIIGQVLKALKDGLIPWKSPWAVLPSQNHITHTVYSGINRLILMLDTRSPYFLTFKQIQSAKGHLKKGSKSLFVMYMDVMFVDEDGKRIYKAKYRKLSDDAKSKYSKVGFAKSYNIFSAADIENVEFPEFQTHQHETEKEIDSLISNLKASANLDLQIDRTSAYYNPDNDKIFLPELKYFESKIEYYGALFHELSHWTYHKTRCNRAVGKITEHDKYGKEELVAEISASILLQSFGLTPLAPENSVSYISHWYNQIEANPQLLISAASEAEKAAAYIMQYNKLEN